MRCKSLALGLAILLAGCANVPGLATRVAGSGVDAAALNAKEVMVKLKPGKLTTQRLGGLRVRRSLPQIGWQVMDVTGDPLQTLAALRQDGNVEVAELQREVHLFNPPREIPPPGVRFTLGFNDPEQVNRAKIDARIQMQKAWEITTGSPNVVVAILDTGIDANHPELRNRLVPGWNTLENNDNLYDDHSHGTACAGIVVAEANNGIGLAGMAPDCRVMPVKVLNKRGVGPLEWAAAGILWATDHGARVVSMSFGEDQPSQILQDAIDYARAHKVLCIASMGNDGEEVKHWPACSENVLAMGATYEDDRPALFTTEGSWVSMAAPGSRVYTTMPTYELTDPMYGKRDKNYTYFSGTSASSPVVAAAAALVISREPNIDEASLRRRLRKTADDVGSPGWDRQSGDGRVNIYRALTERP
jgi:subtilisin family serine protease